MFCDTVIVLREGRVVAGGRPRDVLTPELIADVYGVRAVVTHDAARGCSQVLFDAAPL
jgi:iron complex transport system ATP-binding protein